MAKQRLYGVFRGSKWGMTRNKRRALQAAKKHGAEVRAMDLPESNGAWDYPTFYLLSDRIADFRRDT